MFEPIVLVARVVVGSIRPVTAMARWRLVAATLLTLFAAWMARALEHRARRRAVEVVRPILG